MKLFKANWKSKIPLIRRWALFDLANNEILDDTTILEMAFSDPDEKTRLSATKILGERKRKDLLISLMHKSKDEMVLLDAISFFSKEEQRQMMNNFKAPILLRNITYDLYDIREVMELFASATIIPLQLLLIERVTSHELLYEMDDRIDWDVSFLLEASENETLDNSVRKAALAVYEKLVSRFNKYR